jgi:hypothetical protein
MVLRMARPWKHPSGVYYVREHIPHDVHLSRLATLLATA